VNEPATWLLVGPPGVVLGLAVSVALAPTHRVAAFGLGLVGAAVAWGVIDMLGGFEGEGYDGLFYYGAIGVNLIGWALGAGLGRELRLILERRTPRRG
jgi:hypothetical protein